MDNEGIKDEGIAEIDIEEELKNADISVSIETKVRTALFFVAWVNQIFAFVGAPTLDLDYTEVYGVVSGVVTFGISIWAWWKNNSFTTPALIGDVAKDVAKYAKL